MSDHILTIIALPGLPSLSLVPLSKHPYPVGRWVRPGRMSDAYWPMPPLLQLSMLQKEKHAKQSCNLNGQLGNLLHSMPMTPDVTIDFKPYFSSELTTCLSRRHNYPRKVYRRMALSFSKQV